jgi:hypothetical protein
LIESPRKSTAASNTGAERERGTERRLDSMGVSILKSSARVVCVALAYVGSGR